MKLFWKFYSVLFYIITLQATAQFLDQKSILVVYYNTAIVFSHWFIIPYFFNILSVLINCAICVFIFCYSSDVKGLFRMPSWLFYLRLLSDGAGHSFDTKTVQAGFAQGELLGFIDLFSLIVPVLPSYFIQWKMTFKK